MIEEKPDYQDKEWLEKQYITLDKSMKQIADEINIASSTIFNWLRKHNIETRKNTPDDIRYRNKEWLKEQYYDLNINTKQIADMCNVTKPTIRNWMRIFGLPMNHTALSKEAHPLWKGGKTIATKGYIMVKKYNHPRGGKQNYIAEHILVMEKDIGRYLTDEEVVHHINGVKNDNQIENLYLYNNSSEHNKGERSLSPLKKMLLEKGVIEFRDGIYCMTEQ